MKTITTQVHKVNGQYDTYASKNSVRRENYSDVAKRLGKNWGDMSKKQKGNFRRRYADKVRDIPTEVVSYEITATVPEIFGEFQLKEAAIDCLINNRQDRTIFLACKNGKSGYQTTNFEIKEMKS